MREQVIGKRYLWSDCNFAIIAVDNRVGNTLRQFEGITFGDDPDRFTAWSRTKRDTPGNDADAARVPCGVPVRPDSQDSPRIGEEFFARDHRSILSAFVEK